MNDLSKPAAGPTAAPAPSTPAADKASELRRAALEYHEFPTPGKISVAPTKSLVNQRDLALAYSPGVAAACEEIAADPNTAFRYTARGNMVGVITNGTAVLGLGAIGPLAAKPVMEGKAVLFKKFAGIDAIDIEIDENDPEKTDRDYRRAGAEVSAVSIWRTSRRQNALRLNARTTRTHAHSRSSTTTSTVLRSSSPPRCTNCVEDHRAARRSPRRNWSPPARVRRRSPALICWSTLACRWSNITAQRI